MRATVLAASALLGTIALASAAGAAPVAASPASPGIGAGAPAIVLVRDGCGIGFHRRIWRGPYGRLRSECVPNGPVYGGPNNGDRRCAPGFVWRAWRGPYGGLRGQCVPVR